MSVGMEAAMKASAVMFSDDDSERLDGWSRSLRALPRCGGVQLGAGDRKQI